VRHGGILLEANDSEGESMKKNTTTNQYVPTDVLKCTVIAVDLAKRVFQVAGQDAAGLTVYEERINSRESFHAFLRKLPTSITVLVETATAENPRQSCSDIASPACCQSPQRAKERS
jgi:transposase